MTAEEAQVLISESNCTSCKIPPGLIWYAILAALLDVANGNPVPADPQVLINEASCASCLIPQGLLPYTILEAIKGMSGLVVSGGQQIYKGTGDPNGVTSTLNNLPSIYQDLDPAGGRLWWKTDEIISNTGWY